MVIGRTFDNKVGGIIIKFFKLLDMVEFGLKEIMAAEEFKKELTIPNYSRPLIVFNGDVFGY